MMITNAQREAREKNIADTLVDYCKNNDENFKIVDFIGEGGCALFYRMRDIVTGRYFIMKAIDTAVTEIGCSIKATDRYVKNEISILKKCKGQKNIIGLLGAWYNRINDDTGETVYLMFLPELEPVSEYFKKNANDEKSILAMTADICKALSFCHIKGIRHNDVKLGNIYYSYSNDCFVLSDFLISRTVFDYSRAITEGGSYIAPEIIAEDMLLDSDGNERCNSDIYSLGIATLLLLAKFNAKGSKDEYLKNLKPEELKAALAKAVKEDPALRYQTAEEFENDINGIDWEKKEYMYSTDAAQCAQLLISGQKSKAKAIAEAGYRVGNIRLTCILAYILSSEGKAKEAIAMLEKIKHTGDSTVLGVYGIIGCTYFDGGKEYKDCIRKSADRGFCLAQYFVGRWMCDGQNGFAKNVEKGMEYINVSANQGFLPSIDYFRKVLKRQKVHDPDEMIKLIEAQLEIEKYNEAKHFPVYSVKAIAGILDLEE